MNASAGCSTSLRHPVLCYSCLHWNGDGEETAPKTVLSAGNSITTSEEDTGRKILVDGESSGSAGDDEWATSGPNWVL